MHVTCSAMELAEREPEIFMASVRIMLIRPARSRSRTFLLNKRAAPSTGEDVPVLFQLSVNFPLQLSASSNENSMPVLREEEALIKVIVAGICNTDFEITKTSAGVDNEVLLKYIKDDLNGVVPEQYMGSEGRIVKTNGKIQNKITKNIHLSLLGFNEFNYKSPNVSFYAYLTSLENIEFEYPKMIRLPLIISSNSKLRVLEESVNATCLYESENNKKAKYLCESKNITSGSNNIQAKKPSIDNFEVEATPLAFKYMKNMSGINNSEELDNLDDTNVYILQNSSIIEQEDYIFVVSGEIDSNESVSFSGGELNLTCYDYSNENSTDVPCTIAKTSGNKFNLTCLVEDELDCNLDNSMLADGNKILIVDFEEGTNGNITIDPDDDNTGSGTYRKNFYRKSSGGLSGGLIALIVIIPIVLVAIVVALIFFRKLFYLNRCYNS